MSRLLLFLALATFKLQENRDYGKTFFEVFPYFFAYDNFTLSAIESDIDDRLVDECISVFNRTGRLARLGTNMPETLKNEPLKYAENIFSILGLPKNLFSYYNNNESNSIKEGLKIFTDLETLIEQHYNKFSPKLKKISVQILERKEQIVMLTISNCSQELGVSEATITRFSRALGFNGYREFQNYLRSLLLDQLDLKNKLLQNIDKDNQTQNFLQHSISKDIKNMTAGLNTINQENFEKTVKILSTANTLYVMGLGISKSLAFFLEFRLRRIGMKIKTLTNGGQEFIENILPLKANDAIIAIGFQKSYKELSVALDYAQKLGVSTVALVENPLSPLSRKSNVSINIKRGPTEELNSLAFPMTICNALVLKVAFEKKNQAIESTNNLNWLNNKLTTEERTSKQLE